MIEITEIIDKLEWFNVENDICFNNSEVYFDDKELRILSVIEGYNHTTLTVEFDKKDIEFMQRGYMKETILKRYLMRINDFDVDEEFNMLWSSTFAEHNQFKPSEFLRILEEDKSQFENINYSLIA